MYEAVVAMSGQAKEELNERIVNKAIKDHQESELDVFDELEETTIEDYEERKSNDCCNWKISYWRCEME